MSDKKKRPGSIMGDDERAKQPRVSQTPPIGVQQIAISRDFDGDEEPTPPPIVVDDIGRAIVRATPAEFAGKRRERKTVQEIAEDLWPARRAFDLVLEHASQIAALKASVDEMRANGPAAVAAAQVAALRAELVGSDGKGGIVGALAAKVERDLDDHRDAMKAVEERATKSDRFVRRFLYAVGGLVGGSILGAIMLIYAAGQSSVRSEQRLNDIRVELSHRAETLDRALTDLRGQVKLLLETSLGTKP